MKPASAKQSVRAYMETARILRRRMRLNRKDSAFVGEDGGEIVYIVDADIAAIFANPKANLHYFDLFAAWLEESLLFGTATLTAEFIFSGSLPGQTGKALITPDHYAEFDAMATAIARHGKNKVANLRDDR